MYEGRDCPGIDDAASQDNFPIIKTLLSIPFSLIHNLGRLCAITPYTPHQRQLIVMSLEIMSLWWWDPSLDEIRDLQKDVATNRRNGAREPLPHPVNHESRKHTTSSATPTLVSPAGSTNTPSHSLDQDKHTIKPHLSPSWPYMPTHFGWFTDRDEGVTNEEMPFIDDGDMVSVVGSPTASGTWTESEDSNHDDVRVVQNEPPLSLDILSWSQNVVDSRPEPLPFVPTSFKRGVISIMSANDILMIKGLIKPTVYIQFLDLSLFF